MRHALRNGYDVAGMHLDFPIAELVHDVAAADLQDLIAIRMSMNRQIVLKRRPEGLVCRDDFEVVDAN